MSTTYHDPEAQLAAIQALASAHRVYQAADSHRDKMIGLCISLDVTPARVRATLDAVRAEGAPCV